MSAESAQTMPERSELVTAEHRLKELGITLPAPPEPFGTYSEAVQTSDLLFLTGMLPTQGRGAAFVGQVGAELDVDTARKAARVGNAIRLVVTGQIVAAVTIDHVGAFGAVVQRLTMGRAIGAVLMIIGVILARR
jgi:hypothetical protein